MHCRKVCLHLQSHTHTQKQVYTHTHTQRGAHTHIHTHTQTGVDTHTQRCIHTHTYTQHTHTHYIYRHNTPPIHTTNDPIVTSMTPFHSTVHNTTKEDAVEPQTKDHFMTLLPFFPPLLCSVSLPVITACPPNRLLYWDPECDGSCLQGSCPSLKTSGTKTRLPHDRLPFSKDLFFGMLLYANERTFCCMLCK